MKNKHKGTKRLAYAQRRRLKEVKFNNNSFNFVKSYCYTVH